MKISQDVVSDEDRRKVLRQEELAKKSFEDLTKDEKIELALEEIYWIVMGGQDLKEFYDSVQFIKKVLISLYDEPIKFGSKPPSKMERV